MNTLMKACAVSIIMLLGVATISPVTAQSDAPEKATITLTEYLDYQCSACSYHQNTVDKIKDKFGDQVQVEYKHFPLTSHQFAALSARAAEAAKNQGKFLEMHTLLLQNQKQWADSNNPTAIFERYAKKLGLDREQFRNDLNAEETQTTVMQAKEEGVNKGVNSTPTFFIDNQKVERMPRSYKEFEQLLQHHLDKKADR